MKEMVNKLSGTRVLVSDGPQDQHGRSKVIRQYPRRSVRRNIAQRREATKARSRRMALGREVVERRREKEQESR